MGTACLGTGQCDRFLNGCSQQLRMDGNFSPPFHIHRITLIVIPELVSTNGIYSVIDRSSFLVETLVL